MASGVALLYAYLYVLLVNEDYALLMGSIGFTLGASVLVAFGVTWSWLIVLSGLALGVVLAIVAIAGDLPTIILVVLSAMAGASAIVGGIMLLTGALDTEAITRSATATEELNDDWYWYVIWLGLVLGGVVTQFSSSQRRAATMRESWAAAGSSAA